MRVRNAYAFEPINKKALFIGALKFVGSVRTAIRPDARHRSGHQPRVAGEMACVSKSRFSLDKIWSSFAKVVPSDSIPEGRPPRDLDQILSKPAWNPVSLGGLA